MKLISLISLALSTVLATAACGSGGDSASAGNSAQPTSGDSIARETVQTAPDTLTLAMVGDIMLGTTYPNVSIAPNDAADIFKAPGDLLRSADLACGNLEGVLADSGKARKTLGAKGSFSFLMPKRLVKRLTEAGFDFVGIANNHAFDFSQPGLNSTMHTLDSVGIAYSGNKACRSVIKQVRGMKVGLCAFGHSQGTQWLSDSATVRSVITDLRSKADVVVVCFHGGAEGSAARHLPNETEYAWGENRGHLRNFAHNCIDWGADVIYGHGPHVVRAMEVYKGRFIAYSLGNFATPTGIGTAGLTGYAPLVRLRVLSTGEMVDGRIHGFIQRRLVGPLPDNNGTVVKEISTLTAQDIPSALNIAPNGQLTIKK